MAALRPPSPQVFEAQQRGILEQLEGNKLVLWFAAVAPVGHFCMGANSRLLTSTVSGNMHGSQRTLLPGHFSLVIWHITSHCHVQASGAMRWLYVCLEPQAGHVQCISSASHQAWPAAGCAKPIFSMQTLVGPQVRWLCLFCRCSLPSRALPVPLLANLAAGISKQQKKLNGKQCTNLLLCSVTD